MEIPVRHTQVMTNEEILSHLATISYDLHDRQSPDPYRYGRFVVGFGSEQPSRLSCQGWAK